MTESLTYWKQGVPDNVRMVILRYAKYDAPVVELYNEALRCLALSADQPINVERLLHCGENLHLCRNVRTLQFGLRTGPFFEPHRLSPGGKRKDYIELFWWRGIEVSLSSLLDDVPRILSLEMEKDLAENHNTALAKMEAEYDRVHALLRDSLDENAISSPLGGHYPLDSLPNYRRAFLWGYLQTHRGEKFSAGRIGDVLGCERTVGLRLWRKVCKKLAMEKNSEIPGGSV